MDTTDKLLAERATTHGNFTTHALITQDLKRIMGETRGWQELTPVQREGLEMIQHKIGRILNGNSHHRDHWDDIAGYARLCSERCAPKTTAKQIEVLVRAQIKPSNDGVTYPGKRVAGDSDYSQKDLDYDDVNGVSHSEG